MGRLKPLSADNIAVSRSQFRGCERLDTGQPYANETDKKSDQEAENSGRIWPTRCQH